VFLLYTLAFFFLCLVLRIGYLAFIKSDWLMEKAESQWTQDSLIAAERGSILDRNGNVLATSANADTIVLHPTQIKDAQEVAEKLSGLLDLTYDYVLERAQNTSKQEVWLKRQVDRDVANEIRELDLAGVDFVVDVKRYYPNNDFMTQVLGFTSIDGEGQEGIELKYNKYLKGQDGRIVTETDAKGNELLFGKEVVVEAEDGYDLYLTVDEVIQSYLEQALEEALETNDAKSAQGIVMDPDTGEILAMAVTPDYDLNDVPRDDLSVLQELSRNKLITDMYEPGSTFKIVTTAAALDSGAIDTNTTFYCPGYKMVDGVKIKCWRTVPHGSETLEEALQNSCNPCFMEMALRMGTDTFYDYLDAFGFNKTTGIDLSGESSGKVMAEKYVQNVDLARMGFGQAIAVTPLQLITAASAAINGGNLYQPYIVEKMVNTQGDTVVQNSPTIVRRVISEETSATMRDLLEKVVTDGSGANAAIDGYRIGGKTGTAQKYDEDGQILQGKHVASFIGFAPADDPEVIILIIVDEPSVAVDFGSVVAAPYVKMVLENTLKYLQIPSTGGTIEQVEVPDVRNMTLTDADSKLENAGLNYVADGTGTVVKMSVAPNTSVNKGTAIQLYMSDKSESEGDYVTVPDLIGKSIVDAKLILNNLDLEMEAQGSGVAVSQSIKSGEEVLVGSTIKVYFEQPDDDSG